MKINSNNLNSSSSSPANEQSSKPPPPTSNSHSGSWAKEKLLALVEKQQALLRAYTSALEEHRLVVVILLGVILFMAALFSLLFLVNLRLAREHQLAAAYRPQRIRLLFDEARNQIAVEWYTRNRTSLSMVWYGTRTFSSSAIGGQQQQEEMGIDKSVGKEEEGGLYKHLVLLGNLIPGINYQYKVGSDEMISDVHYFKVPDHRLTPSSSSSFSFSASRLFRPSVIDPELLDDEQQLEKVIADSARALDGVLDGVLDDLRRVDSLLNGGQEDDEEEEKEDLVTEKD